VPRKVGYPAKRNLATLSKSSDDNPAFGHSRF